MKNSVTLLAICAALICCAPATGGAQQLPLSIDAHGTYSIGRPSVLTAAVAAEVDGHWLHSTDYPKCETKQSTTQGYLGEAVLWDVTCTGLSGAPDLVYSIRAYKSEPFADIRATVENNTGKTIHVEAIRTVDAAGGNIADLNGPQSEDRVLSDSFSEDRPEMQLHDLGDTENQMHRAVGSQLIYNRQSGESLFIGALTSDKFLTILRLHIDKSPRIVSYEVESTGTTELEKENSLQQSPPEDQIQLSLPVAPGESIASEQVLLSVSSDYHHQLETYGSLIRQVHHARVSAPSLMGWWSWTAFYFGLNEGAALTNAQWEAQNLKPYGYNVFHIDEGYQYARGEYTTPNATLFPGGVGPLEYKVRGLGLLPGIWTAPFEVSERSWVYQNHPGWLIRNAQGRPIHAGYVTDNKDQLYMLDVTNPEAADYLRKTYFTLAHQWGIHYIKMDFMDDSAIEGYYYKPNTTAMEAQRIGLQIIRGAVGNDVYLDKDGSVMMNPVGYVDYGRISQDTGHTFDSSKEAAPGIAARYYMNRNYFVSDPDAFAVSTQTIGDQSWHEGKAPATLDEARTSIALAAVAGGMFEIGDNLPSLQNTPERFALLKNEDLINMSRLGHSSVPLDLMTYSAKDGQPSIFYLQESPRQSILTVFNWTEQPTSHTIQLAGLGLAANARYEITDVLRNRPVTVSKGSIALTNAPHAVYVLKIINRDVAAAPPQITIVATQAAKAGETLAFAAQCSSGDPVVGWTWDFGDGVKLEGAQAKHAWTEPGDYTVHLTAKALSGEQAEKTLQVHIEGYMATTFNPSAIQRLQ
jgi:hypothetical protein